MNHRTIKNKFFPLLIPFLLFGCTDNWLDIELTQSCYDEYETTGFITEQKATVVSDNSNPIFLRVKESSEYSYNIWPCNLPAQFQQEGLRVVFSAEIKALPTSEPIDTLDDGTIQYITWDYAGIPACLTSLQVKE